MTQTNIKVSQRVLDESKVTYRLSLWPQRSSSSLWSRWATGARESRSTSNTRSTLQGRKKHQTIRMK